MWISEANFKSTIYFVPELVLNILYFDFKIRMLEFSVLPANIFCPTCWTAFVSESDVLKAKLCRWKVGAGLGFACFSRQNYAQPSFRSQKCRVWGRVRGRVTPTRTPTAIWHQTPLNTNGGCLCCINNNFWMIWHGETAVMRRVDIRSKHDSSILCIIMAPPTFCVRHDSSNGFKISY